MCPVVAGIASAVMGGLQAVAAYQDQSHMAEATRKAAIADHEQKSTEINRRQLQEDDAAAQKINLQNIEEAQHGAEADVSAAAGGVAGVSLDNMLADVGRSYAGNRQTLRENARMSAQQLQLEKKGSAATAQSRINSAPKPNKLALAAGLGSAALSGYNAYKRMS